MKNKGLKKHNSSKSSQIGVNTIGEGEKLRRNAGNKSMEIRQVEVCDVCGHLGFINALMYCSMCSHTAVHQYCLGIPPGSIDDTYHWLCEYCSVSAESGHQNSSFEESFREHAFSFELETKQDENTTILVEEELEPLCILPPIVHQENCEHQCRNICSTFVSHLLNSKEKPEPSSFVQRNMRNCDGSLFQIAEDISGNGSISLDQPFNNSLDREESEASVSSLMEFPKEIMSGLVLLVSLSGDIVIQGGMSFCSCLAPSIANMANSSNGMNSKTSVKELSLYKMKPHLAYSDKPGGNFGEVAYECVDQERVELGECSLGTDKDVDAGQSNAVDICLKDIGEDADGCRIKRKRTSARVKFDLLHPLGPECKRIRNKRCKISPSWNKEAGAFIVVGVPFIGKEGRGQSTDASKVVTPRNTCHRTGQADISVNIDSLVRDGLQVEAINKNCGLFTGMVDTCGNNLKERAVQAADGLCDQEIDTSGLGLDTQRNNCYNVCPSGDLTIACGHQNEKGFFFPNKGIGTNEVLASNSLASSPRCSEGNPCMANCMRKSPPRDGEMFKQVIDVEDMLDENTFHFEKTSYTPNSSTSLQESNLERQPLMCCTNLSSQKLDFSTKILYEEHAIMEKERDEMEEVSNYVKKLKESITYPNAWKEYDVEFQKLKTSHDNVKKKLDEVVKKNRQRMWKVVYELETTKKDLQGKMLELAKKTTEVEMAKELALGKNEAFVQNKKEAYDLWLAGYSTAESVINHLHPELNWDSIKAVGNLMFLRYKSYG